MCYQKHPFEIETEDRLTTINTKIFEIKKKIQLSGTWNVKLDTVYCVFNTILSIISENRTSKTNFNK